MTVRAHIALDQSDSSCRGWSAASIVYLLGGGLTLLAALLPVSGAFHNWRTFAAGVTAVVLAPSLALAARNALDARYLHAPAVAGYLLVALGTTAVGGVPTAVSVLFVLPLLLVGASLPANCTTPYLATTVLLIATNASLAGTAAAITEAIAICFVLIPTALVVKATGDELATVRAANQELKGHDELTGAAHLRRLHQQLGRELARARRMKTTVTLYLADLDGFSMVNETYGEHVGDDMLREAGQAMLQASRDDELVARYRGDRFAIVTAHQNQQSPQAMITRVRIAVERSRMRTCPNLPHTVSFGSATAQVGETVDELIGRAETDLRKTKIRQRTQRISLEPPERRIASADGAE